MFEVVDKYAELIENIPFLIKESKFKKEYIISSLNLTRSTFYNKLRNQSFTISELRQLGALLFPEEAQQYALKKSIERGISAISEGQTRPHEEVMAQFRSRYSG
ncbi:MAG: hypothetical protein AAFX53_14130 [Bacteroidota bacterium]